MSSTSRKDYNPLTPQDPAEELAEVKRAIEILHNQRAVIEFGYRWKVKVGTKNTGYGYQAVMSNTLQEAAFLISGEKKYTIIEQPTLARHRWCTHIIAGSGRPRCSSTVVGVHWKTRVVVESELRAILEDNLCWRCYYTDASAEERKVIDEEQQCGKGLATPPQRWTEPRIQDTKGD